MGQIESQLVKYPKTLHLPWSPGVTDDDKRMDRETAFAMFQKQDVVITEKMDGENTTMYPDHIHARSMDSNYHDSRALVRAIHGTVAHDIPKGWRLCGENMFAKHSIYYDNLESYFLLFSIWNEKNQCLPWDEMEEYAWLFGLKTVPVIFKGVLWDLEAKVRELERTMDFDKQEGFVIRSASDFNLYWFQSHLAKYVRKGHIQTSEHWMSQAIVPNRLKAG